MIFKSRNHVSTASRNLLYFTLSSIMKRNNQIIKMNNQIYQLGMSSSKCLFFCLIFHFENTIRTVAT